MNAMKRSRGPHRASGRRELRRDPGPPRGEAGSARKERVRDA
ncbi:hypothetical protein [Streptomyces sp. A0592]|nr:hypothetical protein [Streptomyces sp. A0592]